MSDTVPALLERGRWTIQLPGESVVEATDRMMRGEPGGEVNLSPGTRKMLDGAFDKDPAPRFKANGHPVRKHR